MYLRCFMAVSMLRTETSSGINLLLNTELWLVGKKRGGKGKIWGGKRRITNVRELMLLK